RCIPRLLDTVWVAPEDSPSRVTLRHVLRRSASVSTPLRTRRGSGSQGIHNRKEVTTNVITRRRFLANSTAALAAAGVHPSLWARTLSARSAADAAAPEVPLLLGVDYYPDQTPESLWDEDARKIAEVGFTNVRVAEFAWALMEPSEGKFDLAWLRRSV